MAGEIGDAVEKGVGETSGGNIELRFKKFFAARLAEFLLRRILGLENAICAEQAAISGSYADFHGRVVCFRKHPEHQAVLFNFPHLDRATRGDQEGWMRRSGIAQEIFSQIDK